MGCRSGLDDENAVVVLLAHQVEEHLETITVEVSELVAARFSSGWFDNAVPIGGLKLPLHFAFGLEAFCRNFASTDGFASNTRLVLAEEADLSVQYFYDQIWFTRIRPLTCKP